MEKWYGSEEIVGFTERCFVQKLKKLILMSSVILLMFLLFSGRVWAFSGGDGSSETPYQISTPEQLDDVRNYLGSHFILINDIDLTTYLSEGGGGYNENGWIPIGTSGTPFTGTFDGNNHIITGLFIDRPSTGYVGLFSLLDDTAIISNLGLKDVNITGDFLVGAFAGGSYGSISNSFATGNVTGTSNNVGGLVGASMGQISNSYAICNVDGTGTVGGLVGYNNGGSIIYCYSVGIVTVDEGSDLGGLTGNTYINASTFYNVSTNGIATNNSGQTFHSGTPKTTTEMVQQSTFEDVSWDFTSVWSIKEGASYPYLQGSSYTPTPPAPESVTMSPAALDFTYGDSISETLSATIAPNDAVQTVLWSTSDSNVAAVNENGQVTPVGVGEATISAVSTSTVGTRTGQAIVIVNKKELTIDGYFFVGDKEYDGTTNTAIGYNELTLVGVEEGDDVTLNPAVAFSDRNTGYKTVILTEDTFLSGADKDNYILSLAGAPTANAYINQKTMTIGGTFTVNDKIYDGTTDATIDTNNLTLEGLITGDEVTLNPRVAFADENIGTGKSVSFEYPSLTGAQSNNYILSSFGAPTATADIAPKELTVGSATAADKIYDGTTEAVITGATLNDVVDGDAVSLENHTAGVFAQADVDTNIQVSTSMTLTGTDAGNYTLAQPTLAADIATKELTVSAISENKTYDGSAEATITGAVLNGVITGDDVTLANQTTGTFAQSDAGTNINVSIVMTLSGTDADNYTLTQPTLTADITPKELTIGGSFTVSDKVYDDTTDAAIAINNLTLDGVVGVDDVTLNAVVAFSDENAGTGKDVGFTGTSSLTGEKKDNYTLSLTGAPTATANITAKEVTVSASAENKIYDGSAEATITGAVLNGVITGDDLTLANQTMGTFAQSDAGTNINVSTVMTLSGTDAGNYTLTQPTLTANITPKELTIGGSFTISDKVFDGTTNAAIDIDNLTLDGIVGVDDVTLNAVAAFADENIGADKAVSLTADSALNGTDKDNYILTLVGAPTTMADIIESSSDGSNSSSRRRSSSETSVQSSTDAQNVIIAPVPEDEAGVASTEIDFETLDSTLEKAFVDDEGKKNIEIEIPSLKDADAYEFTLPTAYLSSDDADVRFNIKTNIAEINLTGNMIEEVTISSEKVSLTIAQADLSKVDEETRDRIGDRPVIKLSLELDGEPYVWNNEDAPVTVSIPYTPTEEEMDNNEHITVWYVDGSGNVIEVPSGRYNPETKMVTFTTTHFSDYAVVYVKKTFDDLGTVSWAKKSIDVLASKGILRGISDTEYAPQENMTRGDYLYFLIRTLNANAKIKGNFDDISSDAYYYKEIAVAKKLGITNGTGNNKFNPDASITRQDMMALTERVLRMLNRLEGQGTASDLNKFADKSLVASDAAGSIATLGKQELINGDGEGINPLGNNTRAEAAVFLYRIYNK